MAIVVVGLSRHLEGLRVVAKTEKGLRQALARHGHQQRIARTTPVGQRERKVAARLGVVAHGFVEFAHVVIENAGRLQPLVLLEDGQGLLVVGNGQMSLVAHVVEVGNRPVEGRIVVVDVALLVSGIALHAVGHGQGLLKIAEGRVIVRAAIGQQPQHAQGIGSRVLPVVTVAQRQRLPRIMGGALAVSVQVAPHQALVGLHPVFIAELAAAGEHRFERIDAMAAMVDVGRGLQTAYEKEKAD